MKYAWIVVLLIVLVTSLLVISIRPVAATNTVSYPPPIVSISICSTDSHDGILQQGSCQPGTFDTHQPVVAPDGTTINYHVSGGVSDEHQSVFAPGKLGSNSDYIFFVASRSAINSDTGVLVLSGVPGGEPNSFGQWVMDFANGYGYYPTPSPTPFPSPPYGQIFESPVGRGCPNVPDGVPAHQDQTFDLNYAALGSVVTDPTKSAGNLLMIYEGTNTCFGTTGGARSNNFYSTVGIATSLDYGHTWPTYHDNPSFAFVPLPEQNTVQGPNAWPTATPVPALGDLVYEGNDTQTTPPSTYGRYPVLSPSVSISTAMATGTPLPATMGDEEMSAFVDDVNNPPSPYLYVTYNDNSGAGALADANEPGGLTIARTQLSRTATVPLNFEKWYVDPNTQVGSWVPNSGIGGYDSPIFPSGFPHDCEASYQKRFGSSLSYVEATKQYVLTFVCVSPGDPASCQATDPNCFQTDKGGGAAWFYATSYDPSDPSQWSKNDALGRTQPIEIDGSWNQYESTVCPDYKGWYPTFMSLDSSTSHLSTSGYVFYLYGCQTADTPQPPGRQYSSRAFKITTTDTTPPVTAAAIVGPLGLNGWYVGATDVNFTATDDLSGVVKTEYSFDNGLTWSTGTSISLSLGGMYNILYRSTDLDGNVEVPKSLTVDLDPHPPAMTITATPSIIFNNVSVATVGISGTIIDNVSGVDLSTAMFSVHDEYGRDEPSGPVTLDAAGNYSFTVNLRTYVRKLDTNGRKYTIKVSAADNAGNARTIETTVVAEPYKQPPQPCGSPCV